MNRNRKCIALQCFRSLDLKSRLSLEFTPLCRWKRQERVIYILCKRGFWWQLWVTADQFQEAWAGLFYLIHEHIVTCTKVFKTAITLKEIMNRLYKDLKLYRLTCMHWSFFTGCIVITLSNNNNIFIKFMKSLPLSIFR